ncbi:hypothetical protein LTR24_001770 [Lithohypha guttulata]|uniref:Uncharacterized protein n=1 Tax=Lithohypha guttulata TaxID=1690604 RepID=A0ABR0KK25_9EURO|nr:hypothetical protein LTR24_001770 [Lithohypha guttulata]
MESKLNASLSQWDHWTRNTSTTTSTTLSSSTSNKSGWGAWQRPGTGSSYDGSSRSGSSSSSNTHNNFASSDPSSSGQWENWYNQPAMYNVPVPTATLAPARHWNSNPKDLVHLHPTEDNKVYYAPDGGSSSKIAHQMAWMFANFTSNAVLLDDSDLCTYSFSVNTNTLVVTFKDSFSFQTAKSLWGAGVIYVLNSDQCNDADETANCYLKAVSLSFDEKSFVCTMSISVVGFQDAVSYFDFEWGTHVPGRGTGSVSGSVKSSTTTSRGSNPTSSSSRSPAYSPSSASTSTGAISTGSGGTSSTSTSSTSFPSTGPFTNGTTTNATEPNGAFSAGDDDNGNCTAPADTKYGLPTACLGQYFDEDLDDSYGYQTVSESGFGSFIAQFNDLIYTDPLPVDAEDDADNENADNALGLSKRLSLIPKFIVKYVAKVLPIQGVTTPYTKEISLMTMQMNVPKDRTLVASPWGQQVLIKSFSKTSTTNPDNKAKLDIYCVDCGMQGTANIQGKVGISILEGIESLGATLKADMSMTLKVGVDASLVYTQKFEQQLFNVPLSPLCVAGVICVGPYLKLGADIELKANAEGQLLAGASITMHNAQASVDIAKFTASASGWQPEFNPIFQANGKIDLSADVGLPLAIVIGINVLNGKYTKEAAIVDRPGLVAKASVAVTAGLGDNGQVTGGAVATDGCTGIATSLELKNDVYISIPGRDRIMVSNPPAKKLAAGCIALPAAPTTPAGTDDTTSTTPENTEGTGVGTDTGSDTNTNTGPSGTNTDETTSGDASTSTTGTDQTGTGSTDANGEGTTTTGSTGTDDTTNTGTTTGGDVTAIQRRSFPNLQRRQTINSTTDSGDIVDTTSSKLANANTTTAAYVQPPTGDKAYNLTDGYEVATLIDTEAHYQVLPCAIGNLLLFGINETVPDYQCGDMWTMTSEDEVVVSDGMSRIPVLFPNEMSKTGVSRIRLVDAENIPVGADEIVFVAGETETDDGDTDPLYYPMDPAGTTYYPLVCLYSDGQPSKIFLAADPEAGITMLQNADVKYSIAGGEVSQCFYLPLIQGMGSYEDEEDDWLEAYEDETSTSATATATGTTTTPASATATVAAATTSTATPTP